MRTSSRNIIIIRHKILFATSSVQRGNIYPQSYFQNTHTHTTNIRRQCMCHARKTKYAPLFIWIVQNVALRGKATQSELIGDPYRGLGHPSNAIDGNLNDNAYHGSCTHTAHHPNPWWRVDLLKKFRVDSVIITNRGDCCSERLNGAVLRIGNSLQNQGNSNPV